MEYIRETLRSAYNKITFPSINKVCCKLMIQRYLGVWLDKKLSVDQLSVELANGCLSLSELNINTKAVNERLAECDISLIVMDGYIGNIRVEVPWLSLLSDSASICIEDLQLVIRGTEVMDMNNVESVVSLIGSFLMGTNGVDMADSVYEEVSKRNNFSSVFLSKDNTADSLRGFINTIQSKFCLSIKNLTLRFEHVSSKGTAIATAVELHIQNVSFEDLDKATNSEFNLNKKFKFSGVSMYTDVFSNSKSSEAILRKTQKEQPIKRAENVKSESARLQSSVQVESYQPEMQDSDMFYSCYENWEQLETSSSDIELSSAPIKFLEVLGDILVVIRTRNGSENANDVDVNGSQIEFDTCIEAVNIFATASQLDIIRRCFSTLSSAKGVTRAEYGKPMSKEGYENILEMLEKKTTGGVLLLEDSQGNQSVFSEYKNTRADESAKNEFRFRIQIGKFAVLIPHCDYLASTYADQLGFEKALDNLRSESECLFASKRGTFEVADKCYQKDHLQMEGMSIRITSNFARTEELLGEIVAGQLNISEFLTPESVAGQNIPIKVNIFAFSQEERIENNANFKMSIKTTLGKGNTKVDVHLGSMRTEVDPSILDRLSNLIVCKPFFDTLSNENNEFVEAPHQIADIGANVRGGMQPEVVVNVKCPEWKVDLKVPKNPSRNNSNFSHTQRNVHDEFFCFGFKQVNISIPIKTEVSVVDILCSEMFGDFCGEESNIVERQQRVFHAAKNEATRINLKVILKKDKSVIGGMVQNSQPSGYTQVLNTSVSDDILNTYPKREGPFSKTQRSYCTGEEAKKIVQAGSRKEILEFQGKCELFASTLLLINIPTLKLHIPAKNLLELLYNRVVNDLALFKLSAPVFANPTLASSGTGPFSDLENANDSNGKEMRGDHFSRNAPHSFVMTLNVDKVAVVCNTTEESRVALNLERVHIGTTSGYHGDRNHTYFHFTSTKIAAGFCDSFGNSRVSNVISSKNFGKWTKECSQLETVSVTDELSSGSSDDAVSIALHMHFKPATNVRDVVVGTALRNTQLFAKPIKNFDEFWVSQLAELFTLQDYIVPDYDLPVISTDVHVCFDNDIIGYDHSWVNSESKLKLRAVLGDSFIVTSIKPDMEILKAMCVLQNCQLLMKDETVKGSVWTDRYNKAKVCSKKFINIAALGSVQLNVSFGLGEKNNSRTFPTLEIRCQNDVLSAWVCADSLATLTNTMVEYIDHFELNTKMEQSENTETKSNVGESTWSYASTKSKQTRMMTAASSLPDDVQRRLESIIEDAVNYTGLNNHCVEFEQIPIAKSEPMEHSNVKSDDLGKVFTNDSEITDDDFCLVPHSDLRRSTAIIPAKSSIKEFAVPVLSDVSLKTNFFPCIDETGDNATDDMKTLTPSFKYFLNGVTIKLCLYAGNDLSDTPSPFRSYSTKEFQNGCGPGQKIEVNSSGGPHRDHSAYIALELNRVTFEKEVFDEKARHSSTTVFKIDDIIIEDCVKTSDIVEMLHQYSVSSEPKRSSAPLICVRVSEDHIRGANLRVSMLPIKINVHQDTLDFLSDFIEETTRLLDSKENQMIQTSSQLPTISVPGSKSINKTAAETSVINQEKSEMFVRSSMIESVHPSKNEMNVFDANDQLEDYGNFLNDLEDEEELEKQRIGKDVANERNVNEDEESEEIGSDDQTFFQQFVFSPSIKIYVDYSGKRKMSPEKTGSLMGILMTFGHLNRMPITLRKINTRVGLLGFESCLTHAVDVWTKDMIKHIPSYIESIGPIRPLVQVGKGIRDLCQMPLSELNKSDGSVLKGLQKGFGSFGVSSATSVIGMAQTITGCVQSLAEMAIQEASPDVPLKKASNGYNEYSETIPADVQHSLQLAYRLLHDKYHGTGTDQQSTAPEKRAVPKSSVQNAFEYAVPAILGPIALASQVTNQLLGGMKNQLRPDSYQDKSRKYGGRKGSGRDHK